MPKVTEWPKNISEHEFQFPKQIDQSIIDLAGTIRRLINKPMWFTKSASGQVFHPDGDARFPDHETKHFSLHHVGIDHTASKKNNTYVDSPNSLCRALDFHMNFSSQDEYFDVSINISGLVGSGGFGMYPNWQNPGFHIDTRGRMHPNTGARWYAKYNDDGKQEYLGVHSWMLTFDNMRRDYGETFNV